MEGGVQLVPYIITYYFIGCFNLWGEVTLLWSLGNIPQQLQLVFLCLTVALINLIIIYYLPSPSLPSCHSMYLFFSFPSGQNITIDLDLLEIVPVIL
jgi:hypothetical protein